MQVGLIMCGDLPDRYSALRGDYPTLVSTMFVDSDTSFDIFDAHRGELPADASAFDGYIISGSASSVYEDEQWMRDLEEFVSGVVDVETPIFGICFGHQLLAQALGGVVKRAENGWGVGVHTMRILESRAWMDPGSETLKLVMTHQDQVVELPAGAIVLGSSDHCPNYLVEFTPIAVGIQGHPEFPAPFARVVYEDKRDQLGGLVDDAIESLSIPTDTSLVAQWTENIFADG